MDVGKAVVASQADLALSGCRYCGLEVSDIAFEDTSVCGLCGLDPSPALDAKVLAPGQRPFAGEDEFLAALVRMQHRDGFRTLDEFVRATFVKETSAELARAYRAGLVLERICDPFAGRAYASQARGMPIEVEERPPDTARMSAVPLIPREPESATSVMGPLSRPPPPATVRSRAPLYPLASVAAADGIVSVDERWFLDECLKRYGLAPAAESEIRVYPPLDWAEAVPPEMRAQVAFDMCTLAMIDGLPDAAETRMIYAYCIEWRIPTSEAKRYLAELQNKNTSFSRRVWLRLRNYLLPGRWQNTQL